jgi:hypothetical protein
MHHKLASAIKICLNPNFFVILDNSKAIFVNEKLIRFEMFTDKFAIARSPFSLFFFFFFF